MNLTEKVNYLKSKISIEFLLKHLNFIDINHSKKTTFCPFHQGNNSNIASIEKEYLRCWACSQNYDIFAIYQKLTYSTFYETITYFFNLIKKEIITSSILNSPKLNTIKKEETKFSRKELFNEYSPLFNKITDTMISIKRNGIKIFIIFMFFLLLVSFLIKTFFTI
ncbi:CHC2 zinc finger domain-containing protein ['Camptotheca acuminata' phytoplasma]|uniref:CHC2 zinc finger domain-containing protein n=1 Tax='Camptotheca acuminata' phytoplasma TaxID=3239192 RepID=UPI00351A8DE4